MPDIVVAAAVGFLVGIRHATDADHVIAVTTIVVRQRDRVAAALTGLLWGVGHTVTIVTVGSAIILFNLAIPYRIGIGMEMSVGFMLIVLGVINVASFLKLGPNRLRRTSRQSQVAADQPQPQAHVNSHRHAPDLAVLASIDRRLVRSRLYRHIRPLVVGMVHGLAGSAGVTLLVVAAVPDPNWAVVYLMVFGLGTIAGMTMISMSIASACRFVHGQSEAVTRHFGLACGLISVVFGVTLAFQMWAAVSASRPG